MKYELHKGNGIQINYFSLIDYKGENNFSRSRSFFNYLLPKGVGLLQLFVLEVDCMLERLLER